MEDHPAAQTNRHNHSCRTSVRRICHESRTNIPGFQKYMVPHLVYIHFPAGMGSTPVVSLTSSPFHQISQLTKIHRYISAIAGIHNSTDQMPIPVWSIQKASKKPARIPAVFPRENLFFNTTAKTTHELHSATTVNNFGISCILFASQIIRQRFHQTFSS